MWILSAVWHGSSSGSFCPAAPPRLLLKRRHLSHRSEIPEKRPRFFSYSHPSGRDLSHLEDLYRGNKPPSAYPSGQPVHPLRTDQECGYDSACGSGTGAHADRECLSGGKPPFSGSAEKPSPRLSWQCFWHRSAALISRYGHPAPVFPAHPADQMFSDHLSENPIRTRHNLLLSESYLLMLSLQVPCRPTRSRSTSRHRFLP